MSGKDIRSSKGSTGQRKSKMIDIAARSRNERWNILRRDRKSVREFKRYIYKVDVQ